MAHIAIVGANIGGLLPTCEFAMIMDTDLRKRRIRDCMPMTFVTITAPRIPPRNITWARMGKWVHWSKIAFEKYFLFNIKRGSTEPLFQKLALRVMGLNRLKD